MDRNPTWRRITGVLIIGFALAVALSIGVQLHSYAVPLGLLAPCVLGVFSCALWLLLRVAEAAESTVHRCTAPGCTFQVRMRHASAAESRRWQEIAAAHPTHDHV
ncbi:hypothetical protein G3I40_08650 [Streptomyces sp. SID14478]|uniref:hypothetical protein n=1 Tax=Streptomyces sp. SID14478 TaxID=2706073 RepID=UPI0013DA73F8|nr:hypothetical protein [Streptomyces sp. SID14478]NEB75299.1 hypothetical protein [Streptomyces sp. SID14478]